MIDRPRKGRASEPPHPSSRLRGRSPSKSRNGPLRRGEGPAFSPLRGEGAALAAPRKSIAVLREGWLSTVVAPSRHTSFVEILSKLMHLHNTSLRRPIEPQRCNFARRDVQVMQRLQRASFSPQGGEGRDEG